MMGRLKHDQGQFFDSFRLDEAVPGDHPIRQIASVLDLSWVHLELAPFYPNIGRPSIDPEAHDPDADCRLRVRNPLRAGIVSRRAGELGLSLVLRAVYRRQGAGPFGVLARAS
jgi:hypothetical protein